MRRVVLDAPELFLNHCTMPPCSTTSHFVLSFGGWIIRIGLLNVRLVNCVTLIETLLTGSFGARHVALPGRVGKPLVGGVFDVVACTLAVAADVLPATSIALTA